MAECAAVSSSAVEGASAEIPSWLVEPSDYLPPKDRDVYIGRSMLSVASVLSHFRLDDGVESRFSPSAPVKMIVGLSCILMTSLSSNFLFTLVMLALVLVRMCLLPAKKLKRVAGASFGAFAMSFLIMLPAILLGQDHSAVLVSSKVFVSAGIAMIVAMTTPFNQITGSLRFFKVPSILILTVDLALKNIVSLGSIALELLTALRLRSVGKNSNKGASMGGVGGVLFLKANDAAQDTYDAMTCRGFDGEYQSFGRGQLKGVDLAWALALAVIIFLFAYLQGAM